MTMLQNRVDPYGNFIRTKARGAWTGTRGVIHNHEQEIIRPFKLKAWLTCRLSFKGRQRIVMSPDRYTELFFLDEATALAAGHRPCCECRREDFNLFKSLWIKANPEYGFNQKTPIGKIDSIIHSERIKKDHTKQTFEKSIQNLPGGSFVSYENQPYLFVNGRLHLWSPFGYGESIGIPGTLTVLTPLSVVNTLRAGYLPQMDGSLQG